MVLIPLKVKLCSYLLAVFERIAAHLEAYYSSLAQESIYRPEIENNPARTRWNNVRRKIVDGSFFILAQPPDMAASEDFSTGPRTRQNGPEVDFAEIFANAQHTLQLHSQTQPVQTYEHQQPRRLADAHTVRATTNVQAPSTFESQQQGIALRGMSAFITDNMSTIRRLSRLPVEYDFTQLMATYGKHMQSSGTVSPAGSKTPSSTTSNSSRNQRIGITPDSHNLPVPLPLRTRAHTAPLDQQLTHRRRPSSPPASTISAPDDMPLRTANAAVAHLNRRQPPRINTALPSSPRASLYFSSSGSVTSRGGRSVAGSTRGLRSDVYVPPVPALPPVNRALPPLPADLRALKLAATATSDERVFQQIRTQV